MLLPSYVQALQPVGQSDRHIHTCTQCDDRKENNDNDNDQVRILAMRATEDNGNKKCARDSLMPAKIFKNI